MIGKKNGQIRQLSRARDKKAKILFLAATQGKSKDGNDTGVIGELLQDNNIF